VLVDGVITGVISAYNRDRTATIDTYHQFIRPSQSTHRMCKFLFFVFCVTRALRGAFLLQTDCAEGRELQQRSEQFVYCSVLFVSAVTGRYKSTA